MHTTVLRMNQLGTHRTIFYLEGRLVCQWMCALERRQMEMGTVNIDSMWKG